MNTKSLIATVVIAMSASTSFAAVSATSNTQSPTMMRAETISAVGELDSSFTRGAVLATRSDLTRATVVADLQRAIRNGELSANGEVPPAFGAAASTSALSRAEVLAQARNLSRTLAN